MSDPKIEREWIVKELNELFNFMDIEAGNNREPREQVMAYLAKCTRLLSALEPILHDLEIDGGRDNCLAIACEFREAIAKVMK
jgi:hypothetical protein